MKTHNQSFKLLILTGVLLLLTSSVIAEPQPGSNVETKVGTLVTTGWLSQHINDSNLIILDCSVYLVLDSSGGMKALSGRTKYKEGHIPSAGFADLTSDLCDEKKQFTYALPTPEQFCIAMGKLGVGDNSTVVLYDSYNSVWAARVWWMLRWVGFDNAALLDGGLKAWIAEGRDLSIKPTNHPVGKLTPSIRPETIADRDEVFAAISDKAVHLIDAMPEAHFRGDMAMYGRPGHIPSAINISAMALTDDSGRYKSDKELTAMFTGDNHNRFITYCGGGIAASSNAFIMTRLGFKDVAVYIGSLQEWVADPDNPLVIGEH